MNTFIVLDPEHFPSVQGGSGMVKAGVYWRKEYFEEVLGIKPGDVFDVHSIEENGTRSINTYSSFYHAHSWMYQKRLQKNVKYFEIHYNKEEPTIEWNYNWVYNDEELEMADKESVKVLKECIDLQLSKSDDYQNPNSNVVQAMHYRRGVDTIHDIMAQKMLRAQSILESNRDPNFESLEDTYKDLINYASFAVSYMRGEMDGQSKDRDMFNRKINE